LGLKIRADLPLKAETLGKGIGWVLAHRLSRNRSELMLGEHLEEHAPSAANVATGSRGCLGTDGGWS